ncbi:MAG: polysaccharide deacetylase family protein [Candidatus Auribacterota bacterium]|nr:polysaccharide deacetylase family protein [Candidatus Auribacterota bacterium]
MKIPILMYHSISDSEEYDELPAACRPMGYRTRVRTFEDHLIALKEGGWSTISLEKLAAGEELPEKAVILTFDDGYADNHHTALPRLLDHGFRATFFLSLSFLGKKGMLGTAEVKELLESGMEIGSHGMGHKLLAGKSEAELRRELTESRRRLIEQFSIPADFFSLPRGYLPRSLPRLARETGYHGLCTSRPGFNTGRGNLFSLRRFPVRSSWGRKEMAAVLSGRGGLYRRLLIKENIRDFFRKRHLIFASQK